MTSRTKIQTSIYLDRDQYRRLKTLSSRTGVPMAVYIRRGLELIFAKELKEASRPEAETGDCADQSVNVQ